MLEIELLTAKLMMHRDLKGVLDKRLHVHCLTSARNKMMVIQVQVNKLMSVFTYVCPLIDHGFRHNIVKVAVEPRGDSRVDPQTTLTII